MARRRTPVKLEGPMDPMLLNIFRDHVAEQCEFALTAVTDLANMQDPWYAASPSTPVPRESTSSNTSTSPAARSPSGATLLRSARSSTSFGGYTQWPGNLWALIGDLTSAIGALRLCDESPPTARPPTPNRRNFPTRGRPRPVDLTLPPGQQHPAGADHHQGDRSGSAGGPQPSHIDSRTPAQNRPSCIDAIGPALATNRASTAANGSGHARHASRTSLWSSGRAGPSGTVCSPTATDGFGAP
jgi:hypothetical protein